MTCLHSDGAVCNQSELSAIRLSCLQSDCAVCMQVHKRVRLAIRLDEVQRVQTKEKGEQSWRQRAADEVLLSNCLHWHFSVFANSLHLQFPLFAVPFTRNCLHWQFPAFAMPFVCTVWHSNFPTAAVSASTKQCIKATYCQGKHAIGPAPFVTQRQGRHCLISNCYVQSMQV